MIREDQTDRLLEDIESLSMACRLLLNLLDALGRDVLGMKNGNNKEKVIAD